MPTALHNSLASVDGAQVLVAKGRNAWRGATKWSASPLRPCDFPSSFKGARPLFTGWQRPGGPLAPGEGKTNLTSKQRARAVYHFPIPERWHVKANNFFCRVQVPRRQKGVRTVRVTGRSSDNPAVVHSPVRQLKPSSAVCLLRPHYEPKSMAIRSSADHCPITNHKYLYHGRPGAHRRQC